MSLEPPFRHLKPEDKQNLCIVLSMLARKGVSYQPSESFQPKTPYTTIELMVSSSMLTKRALDSLKISAHMSRERMSPGHIDDPSTPDYSISATTKALYSFQFKGTPFTLRYEPDTTGLDQRLKEMQVEAANRPPIFGYISL